METQEIRKSTFNIKGEGEMAEMIRNYNWAKTPLGIPDNWPQALKISLSNLLHSGFPMFLFWGKDLTCFYNDAFRPSLGEDGKHPAIGKKGKEVWPEIWDFIGPLIETVLVTGKPVWFEDQLVPFYRNGKVEDIYWTFSYSMVVGDDGEAGGVLVTCKETTEQVNSLKQTLESSAHFSAMIEQAPVAITLTRGLDLVIESINIPMLQIMDKKNKEEVIGKKMIEVVPEVKDQAVLGIVKDVIKTGKAFRGMEVPVDLITSGELRTHYFNLSYTPIIESDLITSVLHIAVDVTDQVRARKKIEESEGRFRLLADASPNLIWMLNPNGSYAYVNTTTLNFLGVSQEEIAEKGWGPFQHPEDLELVSQALKNAIENNQSYEMEHRMLHKNGKFRWVLSQAIPAYDANGKIFAYVGSSIDIEDAKKNQRELKTALEQARLSKEAAELGTFDMDLEKGTMHWDERCRTLFGISHAGIVTYEKDFLEGLHPEDKNRITKIIEKVFIKSISNGEYDVEYRTIGADDGVVRWVRAKGKAYFNKEDKPIRFIGSVLDITEKVMAIQKIEAEVEARTKELAEANDALKVMNKELQRSNQNLEEFAHAASHDLKEPVRKIHFFTQQLKDQLSPHLKEAEIRAFNRIENASERMGNLIDDLLLYSHVSQRPHEMEKVDLNAKIQRVLEDLELDIGDKGAVIHIETLPIVMGYRRQLQQLFQNLISNALKYSKADVAPQVIISSNIVKENGNSFHLISVKDNGIGFEPEYADKIFQMFTRLHGKAEYSGTGVGLSIVKKVVENHNGFIRAESKPGEGSVFNVYLPIE